MSWAHPRCTTRRAARRWMARACSRAWRNSTRWFWRGRRCCDTARRRDEVEERSLARDRVDFLNRCLSGELLSGPVCDTCGTRGEACRTSWGVFYQTVGSDAWAKCWRLPSLSRHLGRRASFGILSVVAPSPHPPTHKGARQRLAGGNDGGKTCAMNIHWCTHSTIEGFCMTPCTNCSANRNMAQA